MDEIAGGLAFIKQEEQLLVPDEGELVRVKEEELLVPDEDIAYSGFSIKQETVDDTGSAFPSAGIKEEEGLQIYYGGHVHIKQEAELLVPDEGEKDPTLNEIENSPYNFKAKKNMNSNISLKYPQREEKPYQCPHCDYKAKQKIHLKIHIMARHTEEKPYQCPDCDYKAKLKNHLKRHITVCHIGEKPHQCPRCDYKAKLNSHLKTHIMAHHTGEKPHQCPHCDYKAVTSSRLKRHITAHHKGRKPRDYKTVSRIRLKT